LRFVPNLGSVFCACWVMAFSRQGAALAPLLDRVAVRLSGLALLGPASAENNESVARATSQVRRLVVACLLVASFSLVMQFLPIIKGWLWFNNAYSGFDCRNLRAWLLESTLTLSVMQLYACSGTLCARGRFCSSGSGNLVGPLAVGWAAWGAFIRTTCPGECREEVPGIWSLVDELLVFGTVACGCTAVSWALVAAIRRKLLEAHEALGSDSGVAAEGGNIVVSQSKAVFGRLVAGPLHDAPPGQTCAICLQESDSHDESLIAQGQPQQPAWHRTRCGHAFHGKCLMEWLRREGTCPLCRSDLHEEFGIQAPARRLAQPSNARGHEVDAFSVSRARGLLENALQQILEDDDDEETGFVIVDDDED